MEKIDFKAEHLLKMDIQDGQSYIAPFMTAQQAKDIEDSGMCYSAVEGDRIYACAGIANLWEGRGFVWSYISKEAVGVKFLKVHRLVRDVLNECTINRLEMAVDVEFQQGHRWAQMLGFDLEAPIMKAYRPDGGDCSLYARVL